MYVGVRKNLNKLLVKYKLFEFINFFEVTLTEFIIK